MWLTCVACIVLLLDSTIREQVSLFSFLDHSKSMTSYTSYTHTKTLSPVSLSILLPIYALQKLLQSCVTTYLSSRSHVIEQMSLIHSHCFWSFTNFSDFLHSQKSYMAFKIMWHASPSMKLSAGFSNPIFYNQSTLLIILLS